MDSTKDLPNATSDTSVTDVATIKTPQRRARLSDKNRWMLKPLKAAVFLETGIRSSGILKRCLRRLGVKLDLRLTSAWKAVRFELVEKIKQVRTIMDPTVEVSSSPQFKVGDKVEWTGYTPLQAYVAMHFPLKIMSINGNMAHLELMSFEVPLSEVVLAA